MKLYVSCTGVCKRIDPPRWIRHHQVNIKERRGHSTMRCCTDHWAKGNIRNKVTIHHVNVQRIATGIHRGLAISAKAGEVCGKNRRLNKEPLILHVRM
jgi:hypothetical protein